MKSSEVPVTQGMLYTVRDDLMSRLNSHENMHRSHEARFDSIDARFDALEDRLIAEIRRVGVIPIKKTFKNP